MRIYYSVPLPPPGEPPKEMATAEDLSPLTLQTFLLACISTVHLLPSSFTHVLLMVQQI